MSQVVLQTVSQKLPILPAKVRALLQALEEPARYTTAELASMVAACGNLEAVLVNMLNSGFFRTRRKVRSAQDAFLLIGFNATRSVILGAVLKGLFPPREIVRNFDRELFLRHCIGTALASEMLAEKAGLSSELNRYRMSTYGFTHDIGTLALDYCLPVTLSRIYAHARSAGVTILQAERHILGELNHGIIGELVCRIWQLPADITNVVAYHHAPRQAKFDRTAVTVLYVGDNISWNYYEKLLSDQGLRYPMEKSVLAELGLSQADAVQIEEALPQQVDQAMRLLTLEAVDFSMLA